MRRHSRGRASAVMMLVACLAPAAGLGCRTRNPEAAGLLADDALAQAGPSPAASPAPGVAAGGDWIVTCRPLEPEPDASTYTFAVAGAVSDWDESQALLVSVVRTRGEERDVVAARAPGHGALTLSGNVFVGFASGVLTAEPAGGASTGLLTLANERGAGGLKVSCALVKGTRG